MPAVSVLLPVYNGEKHIREAVESVLAQTYADFVLYVIDDGSTDKTLSVLESFSDNRLQVIRNEKNRKLIYTLNKGLQIAIEGGYKYIIRMDADDICLPHRFEKQIAFMEANPGVGLCGSWVEEWNEAGPIKISRRSGDNAKIQSELFFQNTLWHPSIILRTEVLAKHNFRYEDQFLHAEDYALWYRMSQVTELANIQEVLLKYRVHNTNVSVVHAEQQRETCVSINEMSLHHLLMQNNVQLSQKEKEELKRNYISLLQTIPFDATKIGKKDMNLFRILIKINDDAKLYNHQDFEKSMAEFILQYWSLWCRKYTPSMFALLFIHGRFYSRYWPLKRQLITAGKCLAGWRSRT